MKDRIKKLITVLQSYADRPWYGPLIGLLATLDNVLVVIPNDGILISSSMLVPRRWFTFAFCVAVGSTVGACILAVLVETYGIEIVLEYYPNITQTASWAYSVEFLERFGVLLVFLVGVTPFVQQPAVILASLANTPLYQLCIAIFAGRFIKFLIMAYIGSHSPQLLKKLWGIQGELEDLGVQKPRP
jgi:membrane protein YqaA with SNARE-associated domain